jgi:phosphatidate cytidylyltransferase
LGGPVFLLFLGLVAFWALVEFAQLLGISIRFGIIVALAVVVPYFLNLHFLVLRWDVYLLLYLVFTASAFFVFMYDKLSFLKAVGLVFGGLYIPVLLSTLFLIRNLDNGMILALAVLLVTWGTDSGAFIAGNLFGKTKLAPKISPNKSWAGAWGGFVAGIIIAAIFGILTDANVLVFVIWGGVTATFGQIGDLSESAFKRYAGVKDSGTLLPGHGGILDRFDSLLFTATISYIFFGMGL